jgi:hypothetical protein
MWGGAPRRPGRLLWLVVWSVALATACSSGGSPSGTGAGDQAADSVSASTSPVTLTPVTTSPVTVSPVTTTPAGLASLDAELDAAEARWRAVPTAAHRIGIEYGVGPWCLGRRAWSVVAGDELLHDGVLERGEGEACDEQTAWTPARLFASVRHMIGEIRSYPSELNRLDVTWDPATGVPTSIEFDLADGADEEFSARVTVTPLPELASLEVLGGVAILSVGESTMTPVLNTHCGLWQLPLQVNRSWWREVDMGRLPTSDIDPMPVAWGRPNEPVTLRLTLIAADLLMAADEDPDAVVHYRPIPDSEFVPCA